MFEVWFFPQGGYQDAKKLLAEEGFFTARELTKRGFGSYYVPWAAHPNNGFRAVYLLIHGSWPYWFYSLEDVEALERRKKRFEPRPDWLTVEKAKQYALYVDFRGDEPVSYMPADRQRLGVCSWCGKIRTDGVTEQDGFKCHCPENK